MSGGLIAVCVLAGLSRFEEHLEFEDDASTNNNTNLQLKRKIGAAVLSWNPEK